LQFAWDQQKNRSNLAKHRVSFMLATLIFDDPHVLSVPDSHVGEDRWVSIGLVSGVLILAVVHTIEEQDDEEIIRIISARKATRQERKIYEEQLTKT